MEIKQGLIKWFVSESALPIFLVYMANQEQPVFRFELGLQREDTLESKPISSLMTKEELEVIFEQLQESLGLVENDGTNNYPSKYAKQINAQKHWLKSNTLEGYILMNELYQELYSSMIANVCAARNIESITMGNKIEARKKFLAENKSD